MTAEEQKKILQKFVAPCKYGITSSDISLAAQEIAAVKSEPAEGAREMLKARYADPQWEPKFDYIIEFANAFAALHAQRLANKMVEEMYSPEKREAFIQAIFNEKVDKAIEERMPKMEECINIANDYVNHKSIKPGTRGLIKDAIIIGMNMFRSRMKGTSK